jgi:hypothetical protein
MSNLNEHMTLIKILAELRNMRNKHEFDEVRQCYNEVCDRLDVLQSKVFQTYQENEHTEEKA